MKLLQGLTVFASAVHPVIGGGILRGGDIDISSHVLDTEDFLVGNEEPRELSSPTNFMTPSVLEPEDISGYARTLEDSGDFRPLTCNQAYSACELWSAVVDEYTDQNGKVFIPCGKCVTMDKTDHSTVIIDTGLHIEGKLEVPNSARVTIQVQHIVVEGELAMVSTDEITDVPKVRVILTGNNNDVTFVPNAENAAACGGPGQSCYIGKKGIVVAGGKLNIEGMPQSCPAWVNPIGTVQSGAAHPDEYPKPPYIEHARPDMCGRESTIYEENFEDASHWYPTGWKTGQGSRIALETDPEEGKYLRVDNRKRTWQAPTFSIEPIRDCLIENEFVFISTRVRIQPTNSSAPSFCSEYGYNCPLVTFTWLNSQDIYLGKVIAFVDPLDLPEDGEWFNLIGEVKLEDYHLAESNVHAQFNVEGVEAGVEIHMSNFKLMFPPVDLYPNPDNVCSELIMNGNADMHDQFIYPMESFVGTDSVLKTVLLGANQTETNRHFLMTGRRAKHASLSTSLAPGCIVLGARYLLKVKLFLDAVEADKATAVLKLSDENDALIGHKTVANCAMTSFEIGWIDCEGYFDFDEQTANAANVELVFVWMEDETSDVYYDDISFKFVSGAEGLPIFPAEVAECWGEGSDVAFMSESLDYDSSHVKKVQNVYDLEGGNWTVDFESQGSFRMVASLSDTPDFAGEIALLSRNIQFESEDTVNAENGGFLTVLKTPGVKQVLDGAAFKHFGQQHREHRFPIYFHGSGDVTGSSVSRNSIRESNQRCIVIAGTDGLHVKDNVAYDTFGHCFVLHDGGEANNVLEHNLGARTKAIPSTKLLQSATDHTPATFLIRSPRNTLKGNVAAGSDEAGFWFNMQDKVIGNSAPLYPYFIPTETPMIAFVDNVAHSNKGHGLQTYPGASEIGYSPVETTTFENTRSYRNAQYGMLIHEGQNFLIKGGVFADNSIGLDINYVDAVHVNDIRIIGFSELYNFLVTHKDFPPHSCGVLTAPERQVGLRLYSNYRNKTMQGTTIENVHFSKFSDTVACENSVAITVNDVPRVSNFNAKTLLTGLTFDTGVRKINICDIVDAGVSDVSIRDDGGLNPSGTSPGVVVNYNPALETFGMACTPMPGTCAEYCDNACMRKVTLIVNSQLTDFVQLHVTDENGDELFVTGDTTYISDYQVTLWNSYRTYSVSLPAGSYTAEFIDFDGNPYWPDYVIQQIGDPPFCDDNVFDFILNEPITTCEQIVKNSDFSKGEATSSGWHHTGSGLKYIGRDTGYALSTLTRSDWFTGPALFLDSRCMVTNSTYQIAMKMRLETSGGEPAHCDETAKFGDSVCPRANIKILNEGLDPVFIWNIASAAGPWEDGAWNNFIGNFAVNAAMANAEKVVFFIDRLQPNINIQIDDVTMTKVSEASLCNAMVKNGDFENGHYGGWSYTGQAKLQLVSPGAPTYEDESSKSAQALSTVARTVWYWGQSQSLRQPCFTTGAQYKLSGMAKLQTYDAPTGSSAGYEVECNPFDLYRRSDTCSLVYAKIQKEGEATLYEEIAYTVGPYVKTSIRDGWQQIYGVFTAKEHFAYADSVEFYFTAGHQGVNIIVDDLSIEPATSVDLGYKQCENLALNGNLAMGDARFYSIMGNGKLKMEDRGSSQWALVNYDRTESWHGISQKLNKDCLVKGDWWVIKASFKVVDPAGANPFTCDWSAKFGATCPIFSVYAANALTGDNEHTPVWPRTDDELVNSAWAEGEWNEYTGRFFVTQAMEEYPAISIYVNKVKKGYDVHMHSFSMVPFSTS
mmetsp:Transcript_52985/g.78551  ORF Transcript_52985/g.78551 Transcript_52985/m.78551 type:complete len:1770 (-) Transcript_52985:364-5673(-)